MTTHGPLILGFIAASLDGRITDPSGTVRWLEAFDAHDHGYDAFYAGIDTLVMGRETFDMIRAMSVWPYPGRQAFVLTTRPLADLPPGVEAIPPDFPALREMLHDRGARTVWMVGGAQAIAGALAAGALDRLHLFTMPVILGGGTPLFAGPHDRPVSLVFSRVWPSGAVESVYNFAESFWS